jgi:hypothetical protein
VSSARTAESLANELERLRERIQHVTAMVLDDELQARLRPIRDHLSTTAAMLENPTTDSLTAVADRLRVAENELAIALKLRQSAR